MHLIHIMGCTGAGKGHLIDFLKMKTGDKFGYVEVGKMMRAKYPPDYFKGCGAPPHLHSEAIRMFTEALYAAAKADKRVIVVDGQPRSVSQIEPIRRAGKNIANEFNAAFYQRFVILHASDEIRESRLTAKYLHDEKSKQLAMSRLDGDKIDLWDVLLTLLCSADGPSQVWAVNTTIDAWEKRLYQDLAKLDSGWLPPNEISTSLMD